MYATKISQEISCKDGTITKYNICTYREGITIYGKHNSAYNEWRTLAHDLEK